MSIHADFGFEISTRLRMRSPRCWPGATSRGGRGRRSETRLSAGSAGAFSPAHLGGDSLDGIYRGRMCGLSPCKSYA
jgi:hypothetical protein